MKREDRRPSIRGLDDIECSNLCRTWFKYEELFYHVKRIVDNNLDKSDYFPDFELAEVKEDQIHRVLGIIEDKIRSELFEFAQELEDSTKEVNSYIDGLLDSHGVDAYDK